MIVFLLFLYSMWMVIAGMTSKKHNLVSCFLFLANESFKWDDLKYAIETREMKEWSIGLRDYNASFRKKKDGVGLYGKKDLRKKRKNAKEQRQKEEDCEMVELKDVKEVYNIYDKGAVKNVLEVIFPNSQLG